MSIHRMPTQPVNHDRPAMQLQPFRVSGDWNGGGFAYTLPFSSFGAAHAWAAQKAKFHRGAVVTVVARSVA